MSEPELLQRIQRIHQLYIRLTAQNLSLRFDRQRSWYEFLKAGFTESDLQQVVGFLQREIRAGRRYVGALKLSNLLQLDRFEEDLNISRVRLVPSRPSPSPTSPSSPLTSKQQQQGRQNALARLRELKKNLGL